MHIGKCLRRFVGIYAVLRVLHRADMVGIFIFFGANTI